MPQSVRICLFILFGSSAALAACTTGDLTVDSGVTDGARMNGDSGVGGDSRAEGSVPNDDAARDAPHVLDATLLDGAIRDDATMTVDSIVADAPVGDAAAEDANEDGASEMDAATEDASDHPDAGEPDVGEPDAGELDAGELDAGEPDAGEPDAGEPDAGELDAGEPDAGELDAGEPDAGEPDAGEPDAGEPDAGELDAGRAPINPRLAVLWWYLQNRGEPPLSTPMRQAMRSACLGQCAVVPMSYTGFMDSNPRMFCQGTCSTIMRTDRLSEDFAYACGGNCLNVTDPDLASFCLGAEWCDTIREPDLKSYCYAIRFDDTSACEAIRDQVLHSMCIGECMI